MIRLAYIFLGITAYSILQRRNNNPPVFYVKNLPNGLNGAMIPPVGIFIKKDQKENDELLAHEKIHWQQFRREGLFPFAFNYWNANRKYGYDGNPYEIEARANESEFCRNNYTYCVRNGLAKTVNNPDFRI